MGISYDGEKDAPSWKPSMGEAESLAFSGFIPNALQSAVHMERREMSKRIRKGIRNFPRMFSDRFK